MFGINILALVKAELLKYKDKAGNPIAVDVLDDLQKTLAVLQKFAAKLTPEDIEAILALLPSAVLAKFPQAEVAEFATAFSNLPVEVATLEADLAKVETELKGA